MNPFQFLDELSVIPNNSGDGIRVSRPLNLPADVRTIAGLVLTAATVPAVVAAETNALIVQVIAGQTQGGSFVFEVPKDYDETADELKINVLSNSSANTDAPTLDATVYRKRAGVALSADLNPAATAAISKSATPATAASIRTIDVSGKGIKGGDVLTINLVTGAHATDAVNIYAINVQYKSQLVFNPLTDR